MRGSNENQGCLVMLGIGICLFTSFTFLNTDRHGVGWAVCMFLFIIIPMAAIFIHGIREAEGRRRKGEELRREKEQKTLEEAQRQREELARREWEQTPEGQAFLEQKRREAEQKERAEAERRERLVKEEEEKMRSELERRKKEA